MLVPVMGYKHENSITYIGYKLIKLSTKVNQDLTEKSKSFETLNEIINGK